MSLIENRWVVRVLVGGSLLATLGVMMLACSAPQYEGGGRRTDLGDGGFSLSGSVTNMDSGLGPTPDAGGSDAGCTGDGGPKPLDCLL